MCISAWAVVILPVSPSHRLAHLFGPSKVLAWYFLVGSLWGFSGVSVGVLENCIHLFFFFFAELFFSQTLLKCPQTESSSVLKRPSDSNSALFSVTPRDRLVYASGTVRSTASNNAPYMDRVRQWRGRRYRNMAHTHIPTHSLMEARTREHWQNWKRQETLREVTHQFSLSSSDECTYIHARFVCVVLVAHTVRVHIAQKKMAVSRLPWKCQSVDPCSW